MQNFYKFLNDVAIKFNHSLHTFNKLSINCNLVLMMPLLKTNLMMKISMFLLQSWML